MTKTLIFTDLHMTEAGTTIIGLDPKDRMERVFAHAFALHPDATQAVVLGDLTHHGSHDEYARLKPLLDTCPMPMKLTIGNHDIREEMCAAFGADTLTNGFAQHAWVEDGTLFLLLDTIDEEDHAPRHGGWLCEARLGWIADQIATHQPGRIVAMMHHPPFDTGLPGADRIKLMNGSVLLDLLQKAQVPTHLICGHVHRTISGMVRGIPFTVLKSTCHQSPLDLTNPSSALSVDEPGAYGVLLLTDTQVIVHSEDVFAAARPVALDAASE